MQSKKYYKYIGRVIRPKILIGILRPGKSHLYVCYEGGEYYGDWFDPTSTEWEEISKDEAFMYFL